MVEDPIVVVENLVCRFGPHSVSSWLLLALLAVASHPAHPGERHPNAAVVRGEQLARQVCSACHVVADNQKSAPVLVHPAPRFREIANRPGTNEKALRKFIATTHWDGKTIPITMPNPMLTKQQVADVSSYIVSLRVPD